MTARIPLVINSGAIQELQSGDTFNLGTGATLVSPVITGTGTAIFSQVNIVGQGDLRLEDTTGGEYVALQAPISLASSYTLTLPIDDGVSGQALITDGNGNLSWSTAASGDVYGPASSTNTAVALFDGTTGKLIKNSGVTIDGSNNVGGVAALTASGALTLSSGTANGVAYLNGSKVLTTGSALTFDGATFTVNSQIQLQSSGADSYMNMTGAGGLVFRLGSGYTEQMRLTSTGLGIGTSSPGQKLDVRGSDPVASIRATNTSGSATLQLIGLSSSTNDGGVVNLVAANEGNNPSSYLAFQTRNSAGTIAEKMRLDSSGNLGLGVTPSAWGGGFKSMELGSVGNAIWGTVTSDMYVMSGVYYNSGFKYAVSSKPVSMYEQANGQHMWSIAGSGTAGNAITFTQAMTLDASGNLRLGATSAIASEKLTVTASTTAVYSAFQQSSGITAFYGVDDVGAFSGSYTNQPYVFRTNNAERMRIDSSGNVGIGGTPSQRLDVQSADYVAIRALSTNSSIDTRLQSYSTGNYGYVGTVSNHAFSVITNNSERMRIDSSGNLLVGTTSLSDKVAAETSVSGQSIYRANATNASYAATVFYGTTTRAANAAFDFIGTYANSVGQFRVSGVGTIYAQNTTVQSISDQRLKENIVDSTDGLNVITALRPVRFDFKEGFGNDRKNQLGFIAQEVEPIFPDAVDVWGESDDPESPYKSVGPGALIPVLVKAIQELKAELDATKAEVAALKAN